MSLTYTTYVNSLGNLVPIATTDAGFQLALVNTIDDAEQRLYRELQLLNTTQRDSSSAFVTGTRTFNLPTALSTFFVVESMYAITPVGTSNPDLGTRNFLTPSSRPFIDALFPSANGSGVPLYFAPTTQTSFIVGPWPDQAYQAEVVGTFRPAPISAANATTILSVFFPDLLIAASMVFIAGWMKNYGQAVDDPQQGVTWEQHLGKLLASAQTEEAMKKFTSQGWSSKAPAPLATPPRT